MKQVGVLKHNFIDQKYRGHRRDTSETQVMFSNSSSLSPQDFTSCFVYSFSFTVLASFSVTNVSLQLPFCLTVLFLGLRRRCWQSSTTHSDIFTYHMVLMETVGVSACVVYLYGFFGNAIRIMFAVLLVISYTSQGQLFFHMLTCLDRYIAVVHPITYIRLKERGGARLRNIIIFCVWLLFVLKNFISFNNDTAEHFFFLAFSIAVVSFCNLSVLYVLIRPPPGEGVHVSQSKRRAFHTIMAIMSVLLFRIVMHIFVVGVYISNLMSGKERCGFLMSGVFFGLPSSLVLPLLFLYRAKLTYCKKKTDGVVTGTTA